MEESINKALVQLENDLQDIASAREQVKQTIASSVNLQTVVKEYVTAVKDFVVSVYNWNLSLGEEHRSNTQNLENAVTGFQNSCKTALKNISTSLTTISETFKNDTGFHLQKFADENSKLASYVQSLNANKDIAEIKQTLKTILVELKDSQKKQDSDFAEIKTSANTIAASCDKLLSSITDFESMCKQQFIAFDALLQQHTDNLNTIQTSCESIYQNSTNTHALLADLKANYEAKCIEFHKAILLNRGITIGGFVILAILLYLFK